MEKPVKKYPTGMMYNYREVIDYINKEYNIDTRDYAGRFNKGSSLELPYQDFWHWVVEQCDVTNGSSCNINIYENIDPEIEYEVPQFVREILHLLRYEGFEDGDGHFYFWVSW